MRISHMKSGKVLAVALLFALTTLVAGLMLSPGQKDAHAQTTTLWSATLNPANVAGDTTYGCSSAGSLRCALTARLTDDDFTLGSTEYRIVAISVNNGQMDLHFNTAASADLKKHKLVVGSTEFALSDATANSGSTHFRWTSTGLDWSSGTTVSLSLKKTVPVVIWSGTPYAVTEGTKVHPGRHWPYDTTEFTVTLNINPPLEKSALLYYTFGVNKDVWEKYNCRGGDADYNIDYRPQDSRDRKSTTLQAGATSLQIKVEIMADDYPERDETLVMCIDRPDSQPEYSIPQRKVNITIRNDDGAIPQTPNQPTNLSASVEKEGDGHLIKLRFQAPASGPTPNCYVARYWKDGSDVPDYMGNTVPSNADCKLGPTVEVDGQTYFTKTARRVRMPHLSESSSYQPKDTSVYRFEVVPVIKVTPTRWARFIKTRGTPATLSNVRVSNAPVFYGGSADDAATEKPGAVRKLKVTQNRKGHLKVAWKEPKNGGEAKGYYVRWSLINPLKVKEAFTPNKNLVIKDLKPGRYIVWVQAVNEMGRGAKVAANIGIK